jgi:hypothetical protein
VVSRDLRHARELARQVPTCPMCDQPISPVDPAEASAHG